MVFSATISLFLHGGAMKCHIPEYHDLCPDHPDHPDHPDYHGYLGPLFWAVR
jgi:hypothetical protein